MKRPRILLADDHAIVVEGLQRLLARDFDLVGIADNGVAMIEACRTTRPDLIVADVSMPLLNGIDALRRLRRNGDTTPVVFLTMHPDVTSATRAIESGALGYVVKHSASDELVLAIREALAGRTFVSPSLRSPALEERLVHGEATSLELTDRQREVLQLLAQGKSAKEIGAILGISPRTAETHKYKMMDDLGLSTTAELVRYAIRHGLVSG
ncbi:MAG: response regulator [Vicinamibacterales bacterium]